MRSKYVQIGQPQHNKSYSLVDSENRANQQQQQKNGVHPMSHGVYNSIRNHVFQASKWMALLLLNEHKFWFGFQPNLQLFKLWFCSFGRERKNVEKDSDATSTYTHAYSFVRSFVCSFLLQYFDLAWFECSADDASAQEKRKPNDELFPSSNDG